MTIHSIPPPLPASWAARTYCSFCCSLASAMQWSSITTTHLRSRLTHCLCKVRWGVQQWCLSVPLPLDAGKISIILLPLELCFQICKSLFKHHSSKASILRCSAFFMEQLSHPYMTTGKTIAMTMWTFVGKVMSLLLNKLFRSVIALLPRSKSLLILWLQSPSAVILEPKKTVIVCHCFHCFPIYFSWSDRTGCHDLSLLNVEF